MARTLTALGAGTVAGAVYSPVALTVPTIALPPGMPLTENVTVLGDKGT
ncbi:MAG: hypothetical protein HY021_12555 [Burkholderiales bacterium]|nr:hypothetical protein [Burkholderiales bacterium]